MAIHPLKNYNIMIADADLELAKVLRSMLLEMGFVKCDITTSGQEAYQMLHESLYDFMITEWKTNHVAGIELLKMIRRAPDSPNPVLPVIMLTGRAEQPDVVTARDLGINEFVIKPFTAKTIYDRIERIIESPRAFIVSQNFVGPDRRSRGKPPPGVADRRTNKVQPQLQPTNVKNAIQAAQMPRVWLPDFSLKYKLGTNTKLESLITPAVLSQAQAAVDAISDSSLDWIKGNLTTMHELHDNILGGKLPESAMNDLAEQALEASSRAGTFGYSRASEIAYRLSIFCRSYGRPLKREHLTIVQKYIDVLQVILGNQMRGDAGALGKQVMDELKKLTEKFSA